MVGTIRLHLWWYDWRCAFVLQYGGTFQRGSSLPSRLHDAPQASILPRLRHHTANPQTQCVWLIHSNIISVSNPTTTRRRASLPVCAGAVSSSVTSRDLARRSKASVLWIALVSILALSSARPRSKSTGSVSSRSSPTSTPSSSTTPCSPHGRTYSKWGCSRWRLSTTKVCANTSCGTSREAKQVSASKTWSSRPTSTSSSRSSSMRATASRTRQHSRPSLHVALPRARSTAYSSPARLLSTVLPTSSPSSPSWDACPNSAVVPSSLPSMAVARLPRKGEARRKTTLRATSNASLPNSTHAA